MAELLELKATEPVDVQQVFSDINMGRWQRIRRALDVTTDEIIEDNFLMLMVVAHEWLRQQSHGKDRWEDFNKLNFSEVVEFLGLKDQYDEAIANAESGNSSGD